MLNDFRTLGFNASEGNRKVFDAIFNWVGGRQRHQHELPVLESGHARSATARTSCTRKRSSRSRTRASPITSAASPPDATTSARLTNTCPLAMEVYSSNEYWVKTASLMHTNTQGTADLPGHPLARLYLISSHQHSNPGNVNAKGNCQQFGNPLASEPVQRALWEAMDAVVHARRRAAAEHDPSLRRRHARAAVAAKRGRLPATSRASRTPASSRRVTASTTARTSTPRA